MMDGIIGIVVNIVGKGSIIKLCQYMQKLWHKKLWNKNKIILKKLEYTKQIFKDKRENLNFNKNSRFDFFLIMWYSELYKQTKGVTLSNEIPVEELKRNELLQNARNGDCFIFGDRVDTIWVKEINHEELSSGEVGSGYQIDFVDGTQLKLSTIQLFSILGDRDLTGMDRSRWTLMERNKDTWKGTVREQAVYHDLHNQKVFDATWLEEE